MISHNATLFSGEVGASGDTHLTPINTKYDREAIFFLNITAASGTSPTLDLTIKVYDETTNAWYTLATFTQKTGAGVDIGFVDTGLGENVALYYVVGGTATPKFTFSLTANLKEY